MDYHSINCPPDDQGAIEEIVFMNPDSERDKILYDVYTLKLFDTNGSQVNLSEKEKTEEYIWHFEYGDITLIDGDKLNLIVDIPSPGTLENLFEKDPHPKVSQGMTSFDRIKSKKWFFDMGYDKNTIKRFFNQQRCTSASLWSNIILSEPKYIMEIEILSNWCANFIPLDGSLNSHSIFDELWERNSSPKIRSELCGIFTDIIKGKFHPDDLISIQNYKDSKLFQPICKSLKYFRDHSIKLAGQEGATHFLESVVKYIEGLCVESLLKQKSSDDFMSEVGCDCIRRKTIGADSVIQLICLLKNVKPSIKVRDSFLFTMLTDLVVMQSYLLNDLMSLKNELKETSVNNIILIKSKTMPLDKAFESTVDKLQNVMTDFQIAKAKAFQLFPEDTDFHKYIEVLEYFMVGNIRFYVGHKGNESDFKCTIIAG